MAESDFLKPQQSPKRQQTGSQTTKLPSFMEWRPPGEKSKEHINIGRGLKSGNKNQTEKATILALVLKPEAHLMEKVHEGSKNSNQSSSSNKDLGVRLPQKLPETMVQRKPVVKNIPVLKSTPILQKRSGDLLAAASQHHEHGPNEPPGGKKHEEFDTNYDKVS